MIGEDENGLVDLRVLEEKLKEYGDDEVNKDRVKIGTFTAASSTTGILVETLKVTMLLHMHGFLSFWDYACAGPSVEIDMNPEESESTHKDAIFISTHKFLGGPQTPVITYYELLSNFALLIYF